MKSRTLVTAAFVVAAVVIFLALQSVSVSDEVRIGVLIGVGVVLPTIANGILARRT